AATYFELDLRAGVVLEVEEFPEMRKPSYKIRVNFGPVVGKLWSSAQITNYSRAQLIGRTVVGAVNLGDKTLPTGFVSQFLVLGALDPDGTVRLLELPDGVLPGSMVA
ncbi:MAG: tRNA-binding protein, partial [Candidatus Thalassarchaeum sp.]|nr:tRNA-binding protein [Candidatus Thalassarchaeum sp.]